MNRDAPKRGPRPALIIVAIGLAWAGAFAGAILVDVGVHLAMEAARGPDVISGRYYFDERIGRLLVPDRAVEYSWPEARSGVIDFRMNDRGFREDTNTPRRSARDRRIVVFGDSHTEGVVNNPDSFPNVAEAVLRERGEDVEVLNAGVGMFSFYQQLLWAQRLEELEPDGVVHTFYAGNDFVDMTLTDWYPWLETTEDGVVEHPPTLGERSMLDRWKRRSLLLRWIIGPPAARRPWAPDKGPPQNPIPEFDRARVEYPGILGQDLYQAYYFRHLYPDDWEPAVEKHRWVLRRMKSRARASGAGILIAILPTKYQIERETDAARFREVEEMLDLDPGRRVSDEAANAFAALVREEGLPLLDLRPVLLSARRDGSPLYWTSDHHLNERGHRVVGQALADALAAR